MKAKLHISCKPPEQVVQGMVVNNLVVVNRAVLKRSQVFIASKLSNEDYAELITRFNVQLASVDVEIPEEMEFE